MRKSFLSLVMLATVPVQASAWLNSMPAYKSQISINFINLLGNEQAEVINKGLKSASENHYLAGVLLQESKPTSMALIVANLNQELSGFHFNFNDVNVNAKCTRLKGDVTDELLKVKSDFAPSAKLYANQMGVSRPWYKFKLERKAGYFVNKLNDDVRPNSISICEIPSQFL